MTECISLSLDSSSVPAPVLATFLPRLYPCSHFSQVVDRRGTLISPKRIQLLSTHFARSVLVSTPLSACISFIHPLYSGF